MSIPIGCPMSMRCVSFAGNCPWPWLFPPRVRPAFHEAVLAELVDARDRVVTSRGRRAPRGVKRKMGHFPLRPRRRLRAWVRCVTVRIKTREVNSIGAKALFIIL